MPKTAKKTPRKTKPSIPAKHKDMPATRGMLEAVRQELKSEMRAGFAAVDSKFAAMDSKILAMDSKIEKILTAVSQMQLNNEQQRSDNRIVFERLDIIAKRQDRLEEDVKEVKDTVNLLVKAKPQVSQ